MTIVEADIDPLALERQVCFALAVTNRAVLAVYRPLLEPLGLTHPQYLVMLALWDNHKSHADRPMSVKAIAAALQLDSATLSPMLKRLEALGLITRTRNVADERATDIEPDQDGYPVAPTRPEIPPAVVERLGVGLDELERLHDVLTRVNAAALAAGALDRREGITDEQDRPSSAIHRLRVREAPTRLDARVGCPRSCRSWRSPAAHDPHGDTAASWSSRRSGCCPHRCMCIWR